MDADEIGSDIVELSRKARFADTSLDEWALRIRTLIRAQPEIVGDVTVSDVRAVATAAGGSNGTYLFNASFDRGAGRVEKALVLRFLPVSGLFHHYDVKEQFELQQVLATTDVPVAEQIWLDDAGVYLKRPGYVMAQVAGRTSPMTWMTSGLFFDASIADRREMSLEYVRSLARIHAIDWQKLGLGWLKNRAVAARPMERELNWYWDALVWAKADDTMQALGPVRDWLIANEPTDVDTVLCHGDANLGNYLFDGTRVSAVLDWEMAFLGAPECDLSYIRMGDMIIQGGSVWPEGVLTYDEMRTEYEKLSGRTLRHMDYFELFTAFRVAAIGALAMVHFPPEMRAALRPVIDRGPTICIERARQIGIAI